MESLFGALPVGGEAITCTHRLPKNPSPSSFPEMDVLASPHLTPLSLSLLPSLDTSLSLFKIGCLVHGGVGFNVLKKQKQLPVALVKKWITIPRLTGDHDPY